MLQITIPSVEYWDERHNEFKNIKGQTITLEHSLVSISKWESKWHKPFLSKEEKTNEEYIDYVRCMTLTQNVNAEIYNNLTIENIRQINKYMEDDMTATRINEKNARANREIITSEIIYHWMIALNIPIECQKWHFNRLMTLIRVCNIKSRTPKKRSKRAIMERNAALNAERKKKLNTTG